MYDIHIYLRVQGFRYRVSNRARLHDGGAEALDVRHVRKGPDCLCGQELANLSQYVPQVDTAVDVCLTLTPAWT